VRVRVRFSQQLQLLVLVLLLLLFSAMRCVLWVSWCQWPYCSPPQTCSTTASLWKSSSCFQSLMPLRDKAFRATWGAQGGARYMVCM